MPRALASPFSNCSSFAPLIFASGPLDLSCGTLCAHDNSIVMTPRNTAARAGCPTDFPSIFGVLPRLRDGAIGAGDYAYQLRAERDARAAGLDLVGGRSDG